MNFQCAGIASARAGAHGKAACLGDSHEPTGPRTTRHSGLTERQRAGQPAVLARAAAGATGGNSQWRTGRQPG